jgi:Fe-S-cluster containining protein
VTGADVLRLTEATGEPETHFLEWLSPDEIDMTGEPESFVVVREGRRLPVLAHRDGGCVFLADGRHCTAYAARPLSCRTFPIELDDAEGHALPRRLTVLQDAACPGEFDAAPDVEGWTSRLEVRQRELEEHVHVVAQWNRRQRRRELAGRRPETAEAFLRFVRSRFSER